MMNILHIIRATVLLIMLHCILIASYADDDCSFPEVFIHHESGFVPTTNMGGPNSYFNPLVKVKYRGCGLGISDDYDATITVGKPYSMGGFTYTAVIKQHENVCRNKGVFGKADQQLTEFYEKMCNEPRYNNKVIGICAYRSDLPNFLNNIGDFFKKNLKWGATLIPIAWPLLISGKLEIDVTPPGSTLIDCYPVPLAPLPPPFCNNPVKVSQKVELLRVCEQEEEPVIELSVDRGNGEGSEILADANTVCVKPLNSIYSTHQSPCVRITFDNKMPLSNAEIAQYSSGVSFLDKGGKKEALYQVKTGMPLLRQTKIYSTIEAQYKANPTLCGYNDASFIDLCGVGSKGSITEVMNGKSGDTREFEVIHYCANDGGVCGNNISEDKQICVKEIMPNGNVFYHGCVNTPPPPKPIVSLCEGVINTKKKHCIQFTFPGSETKYQCTRNGQEPVKCNPPIPKYTAIETNDCFDVPIKSVAEEKFGTQTIYNTVYKGVCAPSNCAAGKPKEAAGACAEALGLYYDQNSQYKRGATKFCLQGYRSQMSKPWCTENCNRVCVDAVCFPDKSCDASLRTPGGGACLYYGEPPSDKRYRARNPIEDDLCVDVFLFDFADCNSPDPDIANGCKASTSACTAIDEDGKSYVADCNKTYESCIANKSSDKCYFIADDDKYKRPPPKPSPKK